MKRQSMATLVALFFVTATPLTDADAQGVNVLKGNELRESSIIDALAPPEDGVRTRSIRVRPTGGTPAAGQGQGSASIIVTFATDSAEISDQAKSSLDIVGRALNSDRLANFKFAIEGHADPRGGSDYNLKLSQARAESVAEYLEKYHHVSPDRLRPIGKGDQELANPNVPTAPENRRVTFKTQIE